MKLVTYETHLDKETRQPVLVRERVRNYPTTDAIRNPSDAVGILEFLYDASTLTEEHVWLLCLNAKKRVVGVFEVSHGTISCSFIPPREIFMKACLAGAASIIVAHNHPSGDITPSKTDADATKQLASASKVLGIGLDDHIVIGACGAYYSFMENGSLPNS